MLDIIAFDGDDTLWHNETLYQDVQARYRTILAPFASPEKIDEELLITETHNLATLGYGIKAFALSMIETSVRLSGGRIAGHQVGSIVDLAHEMIHTPVQLLDQVSQVLECLAQSHRLMIITKGDLLDQERKIAQSGLAPFVDHVEILSEKRAQTYSRILEGYGVAADRFLMVGNSLKSDILPVAAIGGHAAYIPYHLNWAAEYVDPEHSRGDHYYELGDISQLPALVAKIEAGA